MEQPQRSGPRSHGESENEIGQENGDGMRSPIQETSDGHVVQIPAGDGGQNCGPRVPVEETMQPNSRGMVSFNRHVIDDDTNAVSSGINEQEQATEDTCSIEDFRLWNQHVNRSNAKEGRMEKRSGTGRYHVMRITEVNQHQRSRTPIFSDAIYTDSYGRKLGIRVYPKGVENGSDTHVAVFVHMMKGPFDAICDWPVSGRIALSVLDQSGAHNDLSHILQVKPNLIAFQRPSEVISRTGYGFVKFSRIEEFFGPQYVKNNEMFIKIEYSS